LWAYRAVIPSVEKVSACYELDTPQTMHTDATAVDRRLPPVSDRLGHTDVYATWPTDQPKREIQITEAAQRIANALHLHLD
jgi:hypothetical protein